MKKLLAVIFAIIMLGCVSVYAEDSNSHRHCFCGGTVALGKHTAHKEYNYNPWDGKSSINYGSDNLVCVYLTDDAHRNAVLNVGNGKTLCLCLNGYTLAMDGSDRVINISSGGKLYLCDCSASGSGMITGGKNTYGGGIHNGGTFYMFGGNVVGNQASYGGGLWNNYNFYFYGGAINENNAQYGGGIWNANSGDAEFKMYDGSINKNKANAGGGIWNNDNANLEIYGGEVVNNQATYGGGVWNQGAKFDLNGGYIYENLAQYGGGVWTQSAMHINGGFVVANVASRLTNEGDLGCGGGVWNNDKSLLRMSAGEVSGNTAGQRGGGVFNNDMADFELEGGLIAGNYAPYGGGVYVQNSDYGKGPGTFRMYNGATISGNGAEFTGAGVYVKGIFEKIGGEVSDIYVDEAGKYSQASDLPTSFVDVPAWEYYVEPVQWAIENNITTGTSDITFSPDDTCNIAQILTFLWRAYGSPEVKVVYEFADVYPDDYFYMAAHWAKSKGVEIVNALYPNFSCSRAAAVHFMWLAEGKPKSDLKLTFTDIPEDYVYYDAIAWAVEKGITSGTTETTFSPSKTCTRAQIMTFLYRNFNNG